MVSGVVTGPLGLCAIAALGVALGLLLVLEGSGAHVAGGSLIGLSLGCVGLSLARRWSLARRALRCPRCAALMHSRYPHGGSVRVCCRSCVTVFETGDYRAAFPATGVGEGRTPSYRELRVDP